MNIKGSITSEGNEHEVRGGGGGGVITRRGQKNHWENEIRWSKKFEDKKKKMTIIRANI
jgi:hypothetical protein